MKQHYLFILVVSFFTNFVVLAQGGQYSKATNTQTTSQTFCGSATVADLQSSESVQWFTSATGGTALSNSTALSTGTYYVEETMPLSVENLGSGFSNPFGVAIESNGKILIADTGNNAIKRMNADGTNISTVNNSFSNPTGVAVRSNNFIYIADFGNNAIKFMRPDGSYLIRLNGANQPRGVAVKPDGEIIYTEIGSSKVMRMSATGYGATELGANNFSSPFSIAIQPDGKILVADTGNNAIKRMNADGTGVTTLVSGLNEPRGVAVKSDGTIYFTDTNNNLIKRMNADGSNVVTVGAPINSPTGIAIQADGKIVVANFSSNKIIRITDAKKLSRVAVAVTIYVAPLPTASNQTFCGSATVANLNATGTNLKWYYNETGGTNLNPDFVLQNRTYYVSQTINGCESLRKAVPIVVHIVPPALSLSSGVTSICSDEILPISTIANPAKITVLSDDFNSPYTAWTSSSGPYGGYTWNLQQSPYVSGFSRVNSKDNTQMLALKYEPYRMYANMSVVSPAFSTVGLLNASLTFWQSLLLHEASAKLFYTIDDGANWIHFATPEDTPQSTTLHYVSYNLPPAALNKSNVKIKFDHNSSVYGYYKFWAIDNLKVTGEPMIQWSPTTNLYSDAAATMPYVSGASVSTVYFKSSMVNTTTYTAKITTATSCFTTANTTITVIPIPAAPTASNQTFCGSALVSNLNATGNNLKWYDAATSGVPLDENLALTTGTFYVSQTVNGCESARKAITVTVNTTNAPVASAQTFCGIATVANLVATGTAIKWYSALTGGTALANSTALATGTYYVSQTINSCESPRTAVTVTVNTTTAPTATAQTFCSGSTVANLVATGTAIKWYSALTGETALATSAALTTGTYYVSQTLNSCESIRTAVTVTVNTTSSPTATAQTFCSGSTVANLAATGTGLKWYSALTGGTALALSTALASGTYYASQTLDGCESPRKSVVVVVNSTPIPISSDQNFCTSATVANLVATGTNIKWYDVATAGTPLATVTSLTTRTYYVTQTVNSCESVRTPVLIIVNAIPTITSTVGQTQTCDSSISAVTISGGLSGVRYIRIKQNLTAAQDGFLHLAEVQAFEIFTGAEVAQGKTATASGKPLLNSPAYQPSHITDGRSLSYYHSALPGDTEWIEVDLGAAYNLNFIRIFRRNDSNFERHRDLQLIFKNEAGIEIHSKKIDISAPASSSITYNVLDVAWTDGATTLNRTGLNDGTYTLTYADVLGCGATHSKTVVGTKPNAPIASAQTFCNGSIVANLVATGTAIKWYSALTGGTVLATSTALATGNYYVSQTINGCESPRTTVMVTVNTTPNTTITHLGDTLTTTEVGAAYQWVLCDGLFTPIAGANSQSYVATAAGDYAVIVTKNGCTVRSDCFAIATLSSRSFDLIQLNYYPNPVTNLLTVTYLKTISTIHVYDSSGRLVINNKVNSSKATIDMSDLAASVYIVKVLTDDTITEFKVIKK
ncbi:streptogramin lyase [Flavobacterium sp. PL11]|uniref:Ig-like domain-containing protein n=1 Tax=Flavobacterium sp. PL11 TaxID=3071717 RepID=UPI002E003AAF|nr:streptogramin lyase [Flavobacterium sp. PL11]